MKTTDIINSFGPMTMAIITLIFGLLNTGLFIIADKWGVIRYYELHRQKWMPDKCEFCLFFWMALTELLIWSFTFRSMCFDFGAVLINIGFGIVAAVVSRFFLKPGA